MMRMIYYCSFSFKWPVYAQVWHLVRLNGPWTLEEIRGFNLVSVAFRGGDFFTLGKRRKGKKQGTTLPLPLSKYAKKKMSRGLAAEIWYANNNTLRVGNDDQPTVSWWGSVNRLLKHCCCEKLGQTSILQMGKWSKLSYFIWDWDLVAQYSLWAPTTPLAETFLKDDTSSRTGRW